MSTRWIIEGIVIALLAVALYFSRGLVPEISELAVMAAVALRLIQISSKLTANLQRLDYSGAALDELRGDLAPLVDYDPANHEISDPPSTELFGVTTVDFSDARMVVSGKSGDYFDKTVNLSLNRGSIYAVVGPNGVGKSTFVKALVGSVDTRLTEGTLAVSNGVSSHFGLPAFRDYLIKAFVPQAPVFMDASVTENLTHDRSSDSETIEKLLKYVGMYDFIKDLPDAFNTQMGDKYGYFSGGQRQRLALVRGLLRSSDILILDEPSSALDENFAQYVIPVSRMYAAERITLIITHDQKTTELCDHIIRVSDENIWMET